MSRRPVVLVTGAGGFIGGHLVERLVDEGYRVRGIDLKEPEYRPSAADEFMLGDLTDSEVALQATRGVDEVYMLAADMGGMGYIGVHSAPVMRDNLRIDVNTIEAARANGVARCFYASSACVYPEHRQEAVDIAPLREDEAYPAQPQDAYGWEKLVGERLCLYFMQDYGLDVRIARFHNVYGPYGTWDGGREKVPAALCRKVATAKLTQTARVEIWGDGEQTRSFSYIDDCVEGIYRLMRSEWANPLNLGQDRMVTINQLADMVAAVAGIEIVKEHVPGPQGVRGRNSDNSLLRATLGWEPQVTLEDGLERTYVWIEAQVAESLARIA